jgi:PTH1 family peptidyl-tRNA hydrolase
MALDPGRIRIRAKGSAGGHKGLENIVEELGTNQFSRLRIGIGKCPDGSAVDYVLGPAFGGTDMERQLLDEAILRAKDAVLCWAEFGIQRAMNEFNPP